MNLAALLALALVPLLILLAQAAPSQPGPAGRPPAATRPARQVEPPASAQATQPATGFLHKTITLEDRTYAYCVWVPPGYTPERPWPVILFLHGSGERGDDGFLQTDVGIARAIRRAPARFPAIVIMPQCRPDDVWWSEAMMTLAVRCVEKSSSEYHLDRDRIVLTGLSLGGAGAYQLGARSAGNFSAVVPVCGFWSRLQEPESPETLRAAAERLAKVPMRVFHGARDAAVPVDRTRELVRAIRAAGGEVEYTEFPDGDHFIWDRVYEDPNLVAWMLKQKRRGG